MGIKRRIFLLGSAAVVGGGVFALEWTHSRMRTRAGTISAKSGEASFSGWLKIASDDTVTVYSPHIDFGQGTHTALAQMAAEELDADWTHVRAEQAPVDPAFANTAQVMNQLSAAKLPAWLATAAEPAYSFLARRIEVQITGGSSAIRGTGQLCMRVIGAAARLALLETAAERLKVPVTELTTSGSRVVHARTSTSLRYGELAVDAAQRSMESRPKLKDPKDFKLIGKKLLRLDTPAKIDGSAQYGIDFSLPNMRIATIRAAPVRGGKLVSVDPAPALAIPGVEKVLKLDDAVVVVAKGYWAASRGLSALSPSFSDGGHVALTSDSIFAAQTQLRSTGKPEHTSNDGDAVAAFAQPGVKPVDAVYRVPFLHQATMEPLAMSAQYSGGELQLWGGSQNPLATPGLAAAAAGIDAAHVRFHPMIMGGGFGRRFPGYLQTIGQVAKIAMQLPYPVKLIYSREEDVTQGAYRPQCSAQLRAALTADGRIAAWTSDFVQFDNGTYDARPLYDLPAVALRHFKYISNQGDAYWRSVNASQHGFYTESFVDELAHAAGADPFEFRRKHLLTKPRHLRVLEEAARRGSWTSKLAPGIGRGIAIFESFHTIVAVVVEASMKQGERPQVHRVTAVVDCGTVISPTNAEAQVQGAINMGLSTAIGEQITLAKGAVQQSNFHDYPLLRANEAPPIDVSFIDSGAPLGGLGEPGLPPVAPALTNALFVATGLRLRQLPIVGAG